MNTITSAPNRFKLFGAGLTLAALVIAVLAVTFATGPAWAGVVGNVPDPCGPGQDPDNYPDDPAAQKSSGHYAIFDAYWLPDPRLDEEDPETGTLNNNLCPPAAKHKDKTNPRTHVTVEETTLTATDIDLRSTIIQVGDTHLKDVVATDAAAGNDKLSLHTYRQVRKALRLLGGPEGKTLLPVPDGTQVYWLRLEDPALGTGPSSLVLGFSTGLLDEKDWYLEDAEGNPLEPFQYELEAVRYHGPHADDLPHVLTYREPAMRNGNGTAIVVWDGLNTDVNSMPLDAGEYEHLEWVFTHPGTYVLEVHLKGHVRQEEPEGAGSEWDGWKPITDEETVTSEVREYTFQVGPLTVNDSPTFGVVRSVKENSNGGTKVGDPIKVFTSDSDVLHYSLSGPGADKFYANAVHGGAQISVRVGAVLDYEAKQTYDLLLNVSDGKDREGNPEEYFTVDDTIVVQVNLVDVPPGIGVDVNKVNPRVGETVRIRGDFLEFLGYIPDSASWSIRFIDSEGELLRTEWMTVNGNRGEYDLTGTEAGTKYYQLVCEYTIEYEFRPDEHKTHIADFTINWQPASQ